MHEGMRREKNDLKGRNDWLLLFVLFGGLHLFSLFLSIIIKSVMRLFRLFIFFVCFYHFYS